MKREDMFIFKKKKTYIIMPSSLKIKVKRLGKNFNKIFKDCKNINVHKSSSTTSWVYNPSKALDECPCEYHVYYRERIRNGNLNSLQRPNLTNYGKYFNEDDADQTEGASNDVSEIDDPAKDSQEAMIMHGNPDKKRLLST